HRVCVAGVQGGQRSFGRFAFGDGGLVVAFGFQLVVRGGGAEGGGRRVGVVAGAADHARVPVGEVAGQFGGHSVDACLPDVEPPFAQALGTVHDDLVRRLGFLQLGGEGVAASGSVERGPGRVQQGGRGRDGCRFGPYFRQPGGGL